MERRHILFIVLVILVLGTHFALRSWLAPPPPPAVAGKEDEKKNEAQDPGKEIPKKGDLAAAKEDKAKGDKAKAEERGKQPQEKPPAGQQPKPPAAAVKPAAGARPVHVTLGSIDPTTNYRELVTLTSRGASVERVELGGDSQRQYFDTEEKSGYLGHLAATATNEGCQINAVGDGTPAFLAKEAGGKVSGGLAVGDIITAIDGVSTPGPVELDDVLKKTVPGQRAEIEVSRQVNGQPQKLTFRAQLTQHPLEVIRPESHDGGATFDPLSFLLTFDRVGSKSLRVGQKEFPGLAMHDDHWKLTKKTPDSAEFSYQVDAAALGEAGQTGSLTIVKRFTLNRAVAGNAGIEHPYSLRLTVEIHNDLAAATPLAYRLTGPNGLPLEGWWYLTKLHPSIGYSAGARDVVWQQPEASQRLLGCRAIFDGELKAKNDKQTYEETLLTSNKPEPIHYVGVDTQFFAAMIMPQNVGQEPIKFRKAFAQAVHDVSQLKKELSRTTNVSMVLVSDAVKVEPGGVLAHDYEIFLGPKDPDVLAAYGPKKLVYLVEKGWPIFMYPTNFLSWVLHLLYGFTDNYGIAIVLLTVMVRACMLPLSIKQAKNAAKMQELAPEIKKIKEKYANETDKQMKAINELYKKHNFNMFGGCLPVFVQLPIFIGLYRCLSVDIALRDAPLIPGLAWASNLAGPDKLFYWKDWLWPMIADETGYLGPYFNILPVVTCVLFILQQKLFMPPATDEQTEMQQKMMMYMTVFMGVMFFKVPAGLCIYFIVSTSWSIIERTFLPKYKPADGGSQPPSKSLAAGPSSNGSPADSRGPKVKKK